MNNVNPEELGRIVANAVASYLQPNVVNSERPQRNESNSTVDSARQSTSSATGQAEDPGGWPCELDLDSNPESRLAIGRPKKNVDPDRLKEMVALGYKITQIATLLGVSRPTVYKLLEEQGINYKGRYSNISASELDGQIARVKVGHPNVGEVMTAGHLRAQGIHVRRVDLRAALHRVDPDGIVERRRLRLRHRVYDCPCPNYVWHMDGNHKLVKWGFVIHVAIDGFSRLVTFAETSTNNEARTVLNHFLSAVETFGRPLRVRTDHGGENTDVWRNMVVANGENSVIVGSSVRNQRVERFNFDINANVTRQFAAIFRELEFEESLSTTNDTDLFCLQYVYTPRINKVLHEFISAHNHHVISTEGSSTPLQLFHAYRHLTELHSSLVHIDPYPALNVQDLLNSCSLPHVEVRTRSCPLSAENLCELQERIDPLAVSLVKGKDLYNQTVEFVASCLLE
ncbi:uncharacterized protein LOC114523947 [Dendronephthya gigantea]|uniref:uncharacterized protein LOC114523947 n=1 Tax=Dendronephthya gigantea TaxID=151771 RepID=UPI00106BB90E|nr:uncharacterized protein LOC114523947 [Dendronephthya gigantea]